MSPEAKGHPVTALDAVEPELLGPPAQPLQTPLGAGDGAWVDGLMSRRSPRGVELSQRPHRFFQRERIVGLVRPAIHWVEFVFPWVVFLVGLLAFAGQASILGSSHHSSPFRKAARASAHSWGRSRTMVAVSIGR